MFEETKMKYTGCHEGLSKRNKYEFQSAIKTYSESFCNARNSQNTYARISIWISATYTVDIFANGLQTLTTWLASYWMLCQTYTSIFLTTDISTNTFALMCTGATWQSIQ